MIEELTGSQGRRNHLLPTNMHRTAQGKYLGRFNLFGIRWYSGTYRSIEQAEASVTRTGRRNQRAADDPTNRRRGRLPDPSRPVRLPCRRHRRSRQERPTRQADPVLRPSRQRHQGARRRREAEVPRSTMARSDVTAPRAEGPTARTGVSTSQRSLRPHPRPGSRGVRNPPGIGRAPAVPESASRMYTDSALESCGYLPRSAR